MAHTGMVDKANGPAVVQSLRHQIGGFVEVNPEGGKISRAAAASPQLESGNWYLPHPQLWRPLQPERAAGF
jgi:predicted phage terminase large subunit-like protein